MIKTYIFLFLLIFLFSESELLADDGKEVNWAEEVEGLKRELSARHVDLYFHYDSISFSRDLEEVVERSPGKSILELAMMLQQVVAKLGDPHTHVNFNYLINTELILPFQCYWFREGIYATAYWKDYESVEGKRIVAINGFPIQQVIDSLTTLISAPTPARVLNEVPRMLIWVQTLEFFGFAQKNEVEIGLEDSMGKQSKVSIPLPSPESERISVGPEPLPLGWQDRSSYFRDQYFADSKLYYIQYNKCWSREAEVEFGSGASALFMPSFKDFEKEALKTAKKKEIDKLVLDLRFNSGGNSLQGTDFIKKLQKTRIGEKAEIYLIVGRTSASAAITNAVDVIKAFKPIVVGEDSGGKPNHFGEVKRFVLTTSNLVVSYSTKFFTLLEENPPAIIPDISVSQSYNGFMEGKDEAMEAISNH